ncbi:metal-sensitive transcriptional regulator [Streptomyces sp. MAG02]|nr:metal-sensitive transcriptional regulator [Streptomyces sp. MAG02]
MPREYVEPQEGQEGTDVGVATSSTTAPGSPGHGYLGEKDAYLRRLHRIEGQVRGLERMVEEEKYCIDILTQIAAVNSALKSLSLKLLSEHMNHCVARAAQCGGQEATDKIDEANRAIARLVRS